MTDTSAFASTDSTKSNKPVDPFKTYKKTAYTLGATKGKGDGARPAFLDMLRQGASEGVILYTQPPRGKPKAGYKDESHVAILAKSHLDGIADNGGDGSKATAKNKLNNVVLAFTDPKDVWQSEATWEKVKELHTSYEAINNNKTTPKADKTAIFAIADAMLNMAAKYAKGYDSTSAKDKSLNRALTEAEIEACVVKPGAATKDFIDVVKSMITKGTKEASTLGDGAPDALGKLLTVARALIEEYEELAKKEDDAEQDEKDDAAAEMQQFNSLQDLIKRGKISIGKDGTLRFKK